VASEVEIVRLDLGHIADAARVNSISPPDNSIQAQHAAAYYPIARDECLEAFDWNFATRREVLTESLVAFDDGEWTYVYNVPSNYIRALTVVPPGAREDHPGESFKLESDVTEQDLVVLTNVEEAVMHYIFREEETGRYSPSFVSALSYLLGSYLAGPMLKGRAGTIVKKELFEQYRFRINTAGAHNANASKSTLQYGGYMPKWISDR
jgi:hypothetical protein